MTWSVQVDGESVKHVEGFAEFFNYYRRLNANSIFKNVNSKQNNADSILER